MKSLRCITRFARLFAVGLNLALALAAFAQPQLILPFDPGAPDQDVVLATRPGIHGREGQSQAAEVYQDRIYYSVYNDGSALPSKVLCFNPTDNSVTTIASSSANMFRTIKAMNGLLWIAHANGRLWAYDGFTLQEKTLTPFSSVNFVSSMTELNGKMYFATSDGHIYESSDGGTFTHRGTITTGKGIYALTTWQGAIYGANSEDYSYSAKIFRSSDGVNWTILGNFNTYSFYGFVPTPTHLYLASVENASGASFAIRATADGTTWSRIFYTTTEGKGLSGRPQFFSQTGRAYFSSEWFYPNPSHVTRIFPAINGTVEARTILQHGFSSFAEVDGKLYAIGAQAKASWVTAPHVVSRLGKYSNLPAPIGLTGVPKNEGVRLEWEWEGGEVDKFIVYVEHLIAGQFALLDAVESTRTKCKVESLVNGEIYRFTASASKNGVISAASNPWIGVPGSFSYSAAPTKPRYPLVFLHGFRGSGRGTFEDTLDFMSGTLGWKVGGHLVISNDVVEPVGLVNPSGDYFTVDFSENTGGLEKQGAEVGKFLGYLKGIGNTKRFGIVAHSNGGLAARQYLVNVRPSSTDDVAEFVTYGTPHRGADVKELASRLQPVIGQLPQVLGLWLSLKTNAQGALDASFACDGDTVELSEFLSNLQKPLPANIDKYSSIVAHFHGKAFGIVPLGERGWNDDCHSRHWDGLVPISSADLNQTGLCPQGAQVISTSESHLGGQGGDYSAILSAVSWNSLQVNVLSPVDLEVVDPTGAKLSRGMGAIPGASFDEIQDSDTHTTGQALIPFPVPGQYMLRITPKPGALPTDTFSLTITTNGVTAYLVRNVQVQDINPQGYALILPPPDRDGDGIPDAGDSCPDTATGEVVNTNGCSIAQIVPASGTYRNHGAYVSAVAHVAEEFLAQGLISEAQKDAIIASAAQSNVGKQPRIHGFSVNRSTAGGNSVELKWQPIFGKRYQVERSSNPSGPFTPIARDLGATPPENVFTDNSPVGSEAGFYRVVEQ